VKEKVSMAPSVKEYGGKIRTWKKEMLEN